MQITVAAAVCQFYTANSERGVKAVCVRVHIKTETSGFIAAQYALHDADCTKT